MLDGGGNFFCATPAVWLGTGALTLTRVSYWEGRNDMVSCWERQLDSSEISEDIVSFSYNYGSAKCRNLYGYDFLKIVLLFSNTSR